MADLIQRLQNEAHDFNFFQAVSLLEEKIAAETNKDPLNSGKIRFVPDPSIVFPPNDITSITEKKGVFTFLLPFMGLVGVSSPLPIYFSEYISRYPDNSGPLYDFITIFNHRLYTLFYKAWKKYHFMRSFTGTGTDQFSQQMASLAGLDKDSLDPERLRLIAYCAILSSNRSATGLKPYYQIILEAYPFLFRNFFRDGHSFTNLNQLVLTVVWEKIRFSVIHIMIIPENSGLFWAH